MVKAKIIAFFCKECRYELPKWTGQRPVCKAWNSMVKEPVSRSAGSQDGLRRLSSGSQESSISAAKPSLLSEIDIEEQGRISTGFGELDRVLGDGIAVGSLVLMDGDLDTGKPTLLLQICQNLAGARRWVSYMSREESLRQIKMRANRIGPVTGELKFLCEMSPEHIGRTIDTENPRIAVIDSIQTIYREEMSSVPGNAGRVREFTGTLMQITKNCGVAIFVMGHATKEGMMAGPKVLRHMMDMVLYSGGDRNASYRTLWNMKNQFGPTNGIGAFEMQEQGLAEVEGSSGCMLNDRPEEASDAVVPCPSEGTRPILLEVQALVTETNFSMPRRTVVGVDYNRVNLLMAVLEKRCRYEMSRLDAYVNIAGGMKINESTLGLVIIMAPMSSYKDRPVDSKMPILGKVGPSGEVRAVSQAGQRIDEAAKLGFATRVLSKICADKMRQVEGICLIGASNMREAIGII